MIDQLMRAIPTDQIAERLGEDPGQTRAAVQASLPALLGGLAGNAQSRDGAGSLLNALGKHQDGLVDNIALDRIDTQDGEKILGHVFGGNTDGVVNQLGGLGGGSGQLIRRLLPILAPIVLSWLAKQMTGAGAGGARQGGGVPGGDRSGGIGQPDGPLGQGRPAPESAGAQDRDGADMTSVLQDVLGSALGGGAGQSPRSGSGSILSDVLGGLTGGRR